MLVYNDTDDILTILPEKGIIGDKNVKKKEDAGLGQSGCEYDCEKEDFPTFSTVAMFLGNHSAVYKSNDFTLRSWC